MLRSLKLKSYYSLSSRLSSRLLSTSTSTSTSITITNTTNDNLIIYNDKRVLVVGDGDLSFSLSLCQYGKCKELIATTWDDETRLFKSFPDAQDNVNKILKNDGRVNYGIDATKLPDYYKQNSFDIVVWNFPHVPGKANIKRNRLLLNNFFNSAKDVINDDGEILVSLVGGQSGTSASNTEEWNRSFKLIQHVAESGCHLVSIKPFAANDYVGYKPLGHRGHGGSFLIDGSESFSIQKSLKQSALQAPLYIHEVHVLAVGIVLDVDLFQAKTRYIVMELCSDINKSHALWTVNLVDIYICPRSRKVSHVFQISYCSLTEPLSRKDADDIRIYIENKLPEKLNLEPRSEKHGHCVSQCYGWYITKALKYLQGIDKESFVVNESTPIKFDKDDGISIALRDIENNSNVDKELNLIQSTARSLWWKRCGVLASLPSAVDIDNIKNYENRDLYNNDNIKQSIESARWKSDKINSLSKN